jgi:DNA polymerase III alpha subunit
MDIDIDFPTTFDPRHLLKQAIPASMLKNGDLVKHQCGYYFQSIPIDPLTNIAAIPYEQAEQLGYFKIDFLHLSLLDGFDSKTEIRTLLAREPDWDLLNNTEHISKLFHLHKHAQLLQRVKPRSVQDLADCLALIRPGKRELVDQYMRNKEKIRPILYTKADNGYSFKRSHAISYALTIVLQLHLIAQGRL